MCEEDLSPKSEGTPCRIAEILQYTCTEQDAAGRPLVHCFPIPRVFRMCRGRPAVEITRLVDIDLATGEVMIPPDASSQKLVVKATWKDVIRYKVEEPSERKTA